MGNPKVFKTLDEQVNILEEKGLVVKDEEYAKEVLLRENYFFLNGYRHVFMKSSDRKVFIPGTSFEELYSLFLFDRSLRTILFKNVTIIENNIKSIISHQLSKKYGFKEKDYLNPHNFNTTGDRRKQVSDLIGKMKRQIRSNAAQHAATMHYVNNYGYIPLWVLVKVLSFGIVAELFSILKKEDQYDIIDFYKIDIEDFVVYLSILANYRNICAHEDIVFENKTQKYINDTIFHRQLQIPITDNEYVYGKNDLFALIIIIKSMLKDNEVYDMVLEIDKAINNLELNLRSIPINKVLDRMGFPENWVEIKNIKKEEMF
ncbi:MAG TPA: Abi family protein [Bacilli bacterium]|nr:Abi family protein [Bacilli bacterium]